jgi:microcystin-dependent protein
VSEPFLSEIKLVSFAFAPKGWAFCNGQLLPINQNQALFSLLGTTFGGDGRVNFGLPNLQGRVPVGVGNGHTLGEIGGEYAHTLTVSEMPTHVHPASVASTATVGTPTSSTVLAQPGKAAYSATSAGTMAAGSVSTSTGGQPHQNTAPYLALQYVIALQGIFPSQN